MSKVPHTVLINHVNSQVIAIPSLMKILAFCKDNATFDRCKMAYSDWCDNITYDGLQIIMQFHDKDDYDFCIARFDMTKLVLLATEPERMIDDELPSDIITRIANYISSITSQ